MALINEQVQVTLSMKLNEAIADIAKAQIAVNGLTEKMVAMGLAGRKNTDEFKAMETEFGIAKEKLDEVLTNSNFKQLAKEQMDQLKGIATAADQTGLSLRALSNIGRQQRAIVTGARVGSDDYKSALAELAILEAKQQAIRDEIADTSKAMKLQSSIFTTAAQVEEASMRDLNRWATGLREQIDRLKPGTEEWIKSNQNLKLVEIQIAKIRTEFQKLDEPVKGSLQAIRAEVQKLQNELEQLPADTEEFKAKIKSLAAAKGELNTVELAINDIGRAAKKAGVSMAEVGYIVKSSIGFTVTDVISNAIQGINQAVHQGVDAIVAYENSLTDLQAITGVTDAELEKLKQSAEELTTIVTDGGNKISSTSTDIFEAFKLVGSAKPELLKDADGLKAVTKEALILAKAGGQDLPEAVKSMTSIMNQFNLPASEARRIINAISAGAKEGSVEITQEAEAIDKFGASAKLANVSLEQSVALAQIVGKVIPEASSAGLQLKTVITNIDQPKLFSKEALTAIKEYGVNIALLEDRTVPFSEKMRELSKIQNDGAAIVRVFGRESQVAATQLLQNVDAFEQMTTAVTGTNEAYTQAAVRSNNLGTDMSNLSADMKQLFLEIAAGNSGALNDLVRGLDDAIVSIRKWIDPLAAARAEHEQLVSSVENLTDNISPLLAEYDKLTGEIEENTKAGKDTRSEQERVKSIIEQVTATIPGVVTEFDKYGIAMDINTTKAREFIRVQQHMSAEAKQNRVEINQQRSTDIDARIKELEKLRDENQKEVSGIKSTLAAGISTTLSGIPGVDISKSAVGKGLFGDLYKGGKADRDAAIAQDAELIALMKEKEAITKELIILSGKETEADMKKRVHDKIFTPEYLAAQQAKLDALHNNTAATNTDTEATEKATSKKEKAHKQEKQAVELVAGSIAYLKEQVSQLNKELENAPPEEQAAVAQRLQLATTKLAEAEEKLNEAKAAAKRLADGPLPGVDNLPTIGATTVKGNDTPQNDKEKISKFKAIVDEKGKIAEEAYNDNILKSKLAEEKKLADIKALLGAAVDAAKIAADAIFSIQNQRLEKRKQNELKQNELIYKDRIKRAEGNEKEISRLEKEREQQAAQIERAAFERKKRLDIAAAVTNGALAITSILAQYPKFDGGIAMGIALGLAAATTIAQVAKIASTKYEKGGILRGASHARGGIAAIDTTTGHKVAEFEGNEPYMILSGDTYRNNKQVVDSLLHSSMYQNGKPIFELGGVFGVQRSDIFPPVIQGGNNTDMLAMISELRALRNDINNREKSSIKAHVVYSDIEQAADELQRIRTRAK